MLSLLHEADISNTPLPPTLLLWVQYVLVFDFRELELKFRKFCIGRPSIRLFANFRISFNRDQFELDWLDV